MEERAVHPSILAWEIPRSEKYGGLRYMGSQRVRHVQCFSDCRSQVSGYEISIPTNLGVGINILMQNAIELEKKKKTLVCTTPGKIKYCFVKKGFLLQCISDS